MTSGLPTINYFLSSELMEPKNGENHYTERLIRLPGIGVYYAKPIIPRALLGKKRSDFGLGNHRVVCWCGQSMFKYLPQHDDIFSRLAKRMPSVQFVFLGQNASVGAAFQKRLEKAFTAEGISANDYCVILPALGPVDYWNLTVLSDIFLDSLEWSGGNTTFEAVACCVPIVTLPGRFMRGRHSYGILTQLGVTETIAQNKDEFLDIAFRLGSNEQYRTQIAQRIGAAHASLYSDSKCVRALESFFYSVVASAVRSC